MGEFPCPGFMKETLIVNLYGGPGSGKSTGAAYLFAKLKMAGVDAEYVTEFAKDKVWEGSQEAFKCQFYISGKQAFRISRCFGKVDVIITDSPIMLGSIYANMNGRQALAKACIEEAKRYAGNSLDIVLKRVKQYNPNGRNQTEQESRGIDGVVRSMLFANGTGYYEVTGDVDGYDKAYSLIMKGLKEAKEYSDSKAAEPVQGESLGRKVVHNGIYRHFKGKYYIVEDVANDSESDTQMVVYRHLYGDRGLCVRPVDMFLSEVDHEKYPDVKQKYRFELVDEFKEEGNDQP